MEPWHREIVELHEFFEQYFAGTLDQGAIARLDSALADGFTIVHPSGVESNREQTIEAITTSYGSRDDLRMEIDDARLLGETEQTILARYVERHIGGGETTERVSTVVFGRDVQQRNGVRWMTVHETWRPSR